MLTVDDVAKNRYIKSLLNFGLPETPVYARVGDKLLEINSVERAQIMTSAGPHDVVVIDVGTTEATENA